MALPVNNSKGGKQAAKGSKPGGQGSKFIVKPGASKAVGVAKKPIKTGGSRGS
ncbi:hypothetical protein [Sediminibacterium ginsengisoli]|uniref:Uncharacterized protein n=1 Tax=Sediminibacterium ginsengisoli TaxID=413434 RepID=A0A1T4L536_9BACT|nr:hypothetical protein [Sediminibacterium ginsengisoli]SJZ49738.1 hypothetical protein SAMN04488132_102304 [Sediminibacterium ginsengisoli]